MNHPSPAIVAQAAVRRLPRVALLLLCAAYVLPGFIGRTPWRVADITAFGTMLQLSSGQSDWLNPTAVDLASADHALLPYWLGAWALQWSPHWLATDFAARLPFIAVLALALAAVWHGVYYLARSPQAQPVAFAFGGEAQPNDYARAIADGGLLAFIACLGLAQLSHETTPAQAQLCFSALSFYAVAALPYHRVLPLLAATVGLAGLALSGAPSMALFFGLGSAVLYGLDREDGTNDDRTAPAHGRSAILLLALSAGVALLATLLQLWHWRLQWPAATWAAWQSLGSLLLWFTWPAWPLVLWTLWRWRKQLLSAQLSRHLALPLWFALITVAATIFSNAGDRALLLALPALATLAAFALPTLERSVSALIDWFTLIFFTGWAFVIWVVWIAVQTGFPPQPAANVARLAPGFEARFIILPFIFAVLGTLAWVWLVRWRAGRHRAAIWKSLVLPAGGATLCWLLATTLWMPMLDYARSYAPLVRRVQAITEPTACIESYGLLPGLATAFKFHTPLKLQAASKQATCPWLIVDKDYLGALPQVITVEQWALHSTMGHPRAGEEDVVIYRRTNDIKTSAP